jgi:hypothetical protein
MDDSASENQGDQIGRIFAQLAIVYFRQFVLKAAKVAHIFIPK